MKITLFCIIVIICFNSYSQDSSFNTFELIQSIKPGKTEGLLVTTTNMPPGPECFDIKADKIFVCDKYNERIIIYDLSLHYLYTINIYTEDDLTKRAITFDVDSNENMYIYNKDDIIYKINKNGEIVKKHYDRLINLYNIFLVNDYIAYYQNNKQLFIIKPDGTYVKDVQTFLNDWYSNEWFVTFYDKSIQKSIKEYCLKNNLINYKGVLFINYFAYYKDYYEILNNTIKFPNINVDSREFIGYDNNSNVYWYYRDQQYERYITIISKNGVELDKFNVNYFLFQVNTNGDIYAMNSKKDGVDFYRIRNTWDPIDSTSDISETPDTPTIPDTPTPPKALSITATSFVDWKNTYTPTKAFDGDPKTGWLEGVKGPGTGEAISLKLDKEITVDEIAVAPGFFDPKWWKSNNRVKSLRITHGNTSRVLQFKDELIVQNVKLTKEIRFSEIAFEITDVYLSGKDNDTAISEIEFYYKGKKVAIDMSGVK